MPEKARTKRGRGRPAHAPTAASRKKVSIAAGGGMRHVDIATALGINRDTLEKHYAVELSIGVHLRRMEALAGLHAAAKRGVPSAVKAYLSIEPQFSVPPDGVGEGFSARVTAAPVAAPAPDPAPMAKPLGKKDQAQADAATAAVGTEWADLMKPAAPLQ